MSKAAQNLVFGSLERLDLKTLSSITQRQMKRLPHKTELSHYVYFTLYSEIVKNLIELEQERGFNEEK